jgi:hypothetical protein
MMPQKKSLAVRELVYIALVPEGHDKTRSVYIPKRISNLTLAVTKMGNLVTTGRLSPFVSQVSSSLHGSVLRAVPVQCHCFKGKAGQQVDESRQIRTVCNSHI